MSEPGAAPDPFAAGDQAEFRAVCQELIRWAGYRTLRQLRDGARERGVPLPVATVSGALNNDRLPTEDVVRRLALACGVDENHWSDARMAIVDQKYQRPAEDDPTPAPVDSDHCPYPGLAAFTPESAAYFFGRESVTATLVGLLGERLDGSGPLVVAGPSGAGKSSILRAGLLPALAAGRLPGSRSWARLVGTPGPQPLSALAQLLAEPSHRPRESVLASLRDDPSHAATLLRDIAGPGRTPAAVVLVDQFEELFTLCQDKDERRLFVRALSALASGPDPAALVVLGVRADHCAGFADHPELADTLRHGQLMLGPMSRAELVAAIERPAEATGLRLDKGLTELLLRDLGIARDRDYPAGALPLLAQALYNSWQQRADGVLTVAGYELTGGLSGAITHAAQRAYLGLDPAGQRLAQFMLLRMVELGIGTEHTRRRVNAAELVASSVNPRRAEAVLDRLISYRLVSTTGDTVEIVHEALLHAWPTLRHWIDEDYSGLLLEQRFIEAARQWAGGGRHESELFRGPRLAEMSERAATAERAGAGALPATATEFLRASQAHQRDTEGRERRAIRRLRLLVAALVGLLLVSIITTGIAVSNRAELVAESKAGRSRELAGTALSLRTANPSLAAQLALVAFQLSPTAEALGAMISSLAYLDPIRWSNSDIGDAVRTVEFSPDGAYLAAASQDHKARVWAIGAERSLAELPIELSHPDEVRVARFSPDHRWLATATRRENVVRLWPLASLNHNPVPIPLPAGPSPLVFGPDGRLLATAVPGRNTVALWEIPAGPNPIPRQLSTLPDQEREVLAAAIDRSGRLLATAGADGTARLWDITDPARPIPHDPFIETFGPIYAVAFSQDGTLLATGHSDKTARLWDVRNRGEAVLLATLTSRTASVFGVAFSPDGHTLATASDDTNARLWNISNPAEPTALADPLSMDADNVYSVAFNPDGHTLASASHNRTVRLWETDPVRVAARICALPRIDRATWHHYLPRVDYQPPCPGAPPGFSPAAAGPAVTTLVAAHSHGCVTAPEGDPSGTPHQGRCDGPGTSWRLRRDIAGPAIRIVSRDSGRCLDASVTVQPPEGATLVRQRVCSPSGAGQLWRLDVLDRHGDIADAHLINLADPSRPRCLDVYGNSLAGDARLVLWPCGEADKANQRFTLSAAAIGY